MLLPGKLPLALAAFCAVMVPQQVTPSDPPKDKPAPPMRVAVEHIVPDAKITLDGMRGLGTGDGSVWVSMREAGKVVRVDPKTNTIAQSIATSKAPCPGMTFGFGAMWVPLCGSDGIARIDPKTNAVTDTMTKGLSGAAGPMVTGVDSLWALTDDRATLVRIDPVSKIVVAEVNTGAGGSSMTFSLDAIWLTNGKTDTLARIDAYRNLIAESIAVGKGPVAVAFGAGSVWTLNAGDATVSRVDPKTNKVTETVKLGVPAGAGQIVVAAGSVWVSAPGLPLVRIDPRTNQVAQIFTGTGGGIVFFAEDSLWIAADGQTLWRLDPKRVEATR
jgi:streptogramin lyase